jgi:hypothetical protein
MMLQAYQKTLIEAATEIHKLLVEHRVIFVEKVQEFVALFEQWREAVIVGQKNALTHKKPKLAFYSGEDIPETFKLPKGCERYKLYELNEFYHTDKSLPLNEHNEKLPFKGKNKDRNVTKRRHVYYGPPLPLNPIDTLRLRDWPCLPFESGNGLYEKDPRDPKEDLLRKFFLLAVIHAFYSHGQSIIDRDSLAAQLVYEAYQHTDDYCIPEKQSLIDTALIDVLAHLDSKEKPQGKAGQDNIGNVESSNEKTSESWFWKLYEKTLKAFFTAIFDKFNPS